MSGADADAGFEAEVAARWAAFEDASAGVAAGPIPAYVVTADPDGAFVVLAAAGILDPLAWALVAGDVRRRFMVGAQTGVDGFEGLRVPWPGGGAGGVVGRVTARAAFTLCR